MADAISRAEGAPPVYVYQFSQKVPQCGATCLPKLAWHGCDASGSQRKAEALRKSCQLGRCARVRRGATPTLPESPLR